MEFQYIVALGLWLHRTVWWGHMAEEVTFLLTARKWRGRSGGKGWDPFQDPISRSQLPPSRLYLLKVLPTSSSTTGSDWALISSVESKGLKKGGNSITMESVKNHIALKVISMSYKIILFGCPWPTVSFRRCLDLAVNLIRFRIATETHLCPHLWGSVYLVKFLWVNWGRNTHPKCEQQPSGRWGLGL